MSVDVLRRRRAEEEDIVEPTFDDVLWTLLFMTSLWIGAASPFDWEGLPTPERREHDDDFM